MKILFVCLGNICRSPLAEGIMRNKVADHGLDWEIDSAGTGHWHIGEAPDPRSIQIALENGIDITDLRGRQFRPADLDRFDRIYAMDTSNYRDIIRHAQTEEQDKIRLIMDHVFPGQEISVPDPYWDDDGFAQVYNMLNEACDQVLQEFKK